MELSIRTYPDPILREKAKEVSSFDDRLKKIANSMIEYIKSLNGIGLAAPQIGISERIILADVDNKPLFIVNPEIVGSKGEEILEEGCLSIPGTYINILRPSIIQLIGYDLNSRKLQIKADNLLARVIQHEIDHIEGRLIIDFLSKEELMRFHLDYNPNQPAVQVKKRE